MKLIKFDQPAQNKPKEKIDSDELEETLKSLLANAGLSIKEIREEILKLRRKLKK